MIERSVIWRLFCLPVLTLAMVFMASCKTAKPAGDVAPVLASEYTQLTQPSCRTTSVQAEGGNSEQMCPGVYGYQLVLLDSDGRMSVTVVAPDGGRHPLDFWQTVTPHFSAIDKVAEWRVRKENKLDAPAGVIIPLNVNEDPNSSTITPYLVVIRLGRAKICVVQKLRSGPTALADARRAADSAADTNCPSQ